LAKTTVYDLIPDFTDADELLSRPSEADVGAAGRIEGDILIVGAGGKMGPTLARLIERASRQAGVDRSVYAASRFSDAAARGALEKQGVRTVVCDATDRESLAGLPDCPNVYYLIGRKFGSTSDPHLTWATNVYAAALAAERFRRSRIVALSTANVYPFSEVTAGGSRESDPVGPVGEYAQTALGRERIFEHFSARFSTPVTLLRLSYAIDLRYGVLRDVAERLVAGHPVDLATGYANVIWQRDANSVVFRSIEKASAPPAVYNLSGRPPVSIREAAERLAELLGVHAHLEGREAETSLLVNVDRCVRDFGAPEMPLEGMLGLTAAWVRSGGEGLGKPTHYGQREGTF